MLERTVILAMLLIVGGVAPAVAQPAGRTVLILNSFEREFAPYSNFAEAIRSELKRRSPVPISFFEVSLQLALTSERPQEEQAVEYLQSILAGQRLDLILTIGGNAAVFVQKYRERIFPATPVLQGALNARRVPPPKPGDNATSVATGDDFPQMIRNVLEVLPATKRVFVVIGSSSFEQYWLKEVTREFAPFTGQLTFEWSNQLSFDGLLARSSSLPPGSAIFFGTLLSDDKGAVQTDGRVLEQLHATANAPIFGQYDIQMGRGIVGGSLTMIMDSARTSADVALRILDGEAPARIGRQITARGLPMYDWRELQRWGISEARLPAGSQVSFRPPSAWAQYRRYIIGAISLVAFQSAMIIGLFVQRARRRRTEQALRQSYEQNHDLAGRLIDAQEQERARIARDLHDDLSQQLAAVGIILSGLKRKIRPSEMEPGVSETVRTLEEHNRALADSVRNLSHELHPSVLQHAGLRHTLQRHCADIEQHHQLTVSFGATGNLEALRPDVALCLFRVAQEALANAVRHARARTIVVRLARTQSGVELSIEDDGVGFGGVERARHGLGLRSMDERVRLVGGTLRLESRPGQGTRLLGRVPYARTPAAVVES